MCMHSRSKSVICTVEWKTSNIHFVAMNIMIYITYINDTFNFETCNLILCATNAAAKRMIE